jgi:hypothetical protein
VKWSSTDAPQQKKRSFASAGHPPTMPPGGGVGRSKAAREATIRGVREMQSSRHSRRAAADVGHGAEHLGLKLTDQNTSARTP